jgi:hypothetical protein
MITTVFQMCGVSIGGYDFGVSRFEDLFDIKFQYGYATSLDKRDCYPSLYLQGVNGGGKLLSSGPLHEKKQLVGKWRDCFSSYSDGKLRSVFELNFLGPILVASGLIDEIRKIEVGEVSDLNSQVVA